MALTQFPVETDKPKTDVTLPVGTHVLELVVEDSAGLRSAPDTVIITVQRAAGVAPTITGIAPANGLPGTTVPATIQGTNLLGATAVTFSGSGVSATVAAAGTDTTLPVTLTIDSIASFGSRTFQVTTPHGIAGSATLGISFTVGFQPSPEPGILATISAIAPAGGQQGTTLDATILGTNLLGAAEVFFTGFGVTAVILPGKTDITLPVRIFIDPGAPVGPRTFQLITPQGGVDSANFGISFTVSSVL